VSFFWGCFFRPLNFKFSEFSSNFNFNGYSPFDHIPTPLERTIDARWRGSNPRHEMTNFVLDPLPVLPDFIITRHSIE
jgi:hypothetical protein